MKIFSRIRYVAFGLCFVIQMYLWVVANMDFSTGTYDLIGGKKDVFFQFGSEVYYFIWLLLFLMPKYGSLFLVFLYVWISWNDEILYLYISAKDININEVYIKDYISYSVQSYGWYFLDRIFTKPLFCFCRIIKYAATVIFLTIYFYLPVLGVHLIVYFIKKIRSKS